MSEIFLRLDYSSVRAGAERRLILSLRDITDEKLTEQEILNQNELLRLALTQAEQAIRAKALFLANMTHELKTPLNSLLGYTQYLQMDSLGSLNPGQGAAVRSVEDSGRHLLKLVEQILDYSKMEADRMQLSIQNCDLSELIRVCVHGLQGLAQERGVSLSFDMPEGSVLIDCDATRIRQVLDNLISNGLKATPSGGQVSVSLLEGPDKVLLRVSDTGVGIAPDEQERIFEAFEQSASNRSQKREGTGLGLAIVRRIVDMHNGFITLQSEVGSGSTFTIGLPVHIAGGTNAPKG